MKIFKKNKKILLLLIFLGIFGIASIGSALELDWPPSPGDTHLNDDSTLPQLIKYLYEWGIAIGGLAVFIALVSAGFQYLGSAGDTGKMTDAKKKIGSAIMGLVLLLSSWLILNTINPELTTFQLVSFSMSDLPPIVGGVSISTPPCEYVKFYEWPDYKVREMVDSSGNDIILNSNKLNHDFGTGPYPISAKAFYTKLPGKKHCNYGADIGNNCIGEVTCDRNEEECESGPTGGGCALELAKGGAFFEYGCGDRIGYSIATNPNFTDLVIEKVKCVSLIFPR